MNSSIGTPVPQRLSIYKNDSNAWDNKAHSPIAKTFLPPASEGRREVIFSLCVSVHTSMGGGSQVQVQVGGVPNPAMDGGGGSPRSQIFWRGVPGLRFSGGGPRSQIFWGGPRSQIFWGGGCPVSIKGKIFDTRFGLIHVQTGKKIFCQGTPPPSKGKKFWHQIWLDTCSDWGKKIFVEGPPPPSKGKNFWHQIWLHTCSDWGKIFCRGTPPPAK